MSTTEYPKRMIHPAYARATSTRIAGSEVYRADGSIKFADYQGTPDRFPPTDVRDADEEEQYRAKGYRPYGESNVTVMAYLEYPKMMVHPDHEPATPTFAAVLNGGGQVVTPAVPGRPAKFPDLTVHNEQEELAAAAKGYRLPGKSDPDAAHASKAHPHVPGRVASEYPKMVNGVLVQDPNVNRSGIQEYPKWIGDVLVHNRAEEIALVGEKPEDKAAKARAKREALLKAKAEAEAELAALDKGEAELPAPAATKEPAKEPEPDERAALIAEAKARGIKIHKQWGAEKLRAALAEASQAA